MAHTYEQRFFSALKDIFIGQPIKGKSGYVNLMDLKARYFSEIEPYIQESIDTIIKPDYREELFEKLYTFFDCYLNETGTVFFAKSQLHRNLYEKVYSDRDDVSLFWKTQKLYYVKSEANYDDLQTEVNGVKIVFDASEIKHAKGNEKKAIVFHLVKADKNSVVFKVKYKEGNSYDRIKEYLSIDKNNDILDTCFEKYGESLHGQVAFNKCELDKDIFTRKGDIRKCINIENIDDVTNTAKVSYTITDFDLILQYLNKKGVILYEDDVKKIFSIYKRQNEIDYFIHKDAEGFLKEQFDIYVYNWLFNDLETDFDSATVKRMQDIKKIAHKVVEYIARFEDELKAIWEKPKFVRNCNYVVTLDRLADNISLIKKIIDSPGFDKQVEEWKYLQSEWVDDKGSLIKKEWRDLNFSLNIDINEVILKNKLNKKYNNLVIDTKYFEHLKIEILSCFSNISEQLDGTIIHSDNWQALNTLKNIEKDNIKLTYVDPPFNTSDTTEFMYKDKFQESTWLSFLSDRIVLLNNITNKEGSFYLHLDSNSNHYGRVLLDNLFNGIYRNEIIWHFSDGTAPIGAFKRKINTIFFYSKSKKNVFNEIRVPVLNPDRYNLTDDDGRAYFEDGHHGSNKRFYLDQGMISDNVWSYVTDNGFRQLNSQSSERFRNFKTQKPETLLKRIITASSNEKDKVLDFFNGSATTIATAHKLKRKWIGVELGEHFNYINIPRLKKVLFGDSSGISNDDNVLWKGGGFFKYYELEQYEEVLAKAKFQWRGVKGESQVEQYSFMQDEKLLDAIDIDYKSENAKIVFEKLYPDVDIAETLSNLSGKHIKQVFEDKVVFVDGTEVIYNEMTFEKYPWIKPLIWWNSKK